MSDAETTTEDTEARHGIVQLVKDLLRFDRTALVILVSVPFVLTLLEYYGMPWHYSRHRETASRLERAMQRPAVNNPPYVEHLGKIEMPGEYSHQLQRYMWWAIGCFVCLVLLPMLVGKFAANKSPRALGVRFKGTLKEAPTYLLLYLIFLPVIYYVSLQPDFQKTYPFFKINPREGLTREFWIFEILYFSQFFAIEFFFRGFMVLGLKKALGMASVLVMLAPYCMIHYYKPMPEAMGAIGAGLVLGIALPTEAARSIYGWWLHFCRSRSAMDLLSLHHRGHAVGVGCIAATGADRERWARLQSLLSHLRARGLRVELTASRARLARLLIFGLSARTRRRHDPHMNQTLLGWAAATAALFSAVACPGDQRTRTSSSCEMARCCLPKRVSELVNPDEYPDGRCLPQRAAGATSTLALRQGVKIGSESVRRLPCSATSTTTNTSRHARRTTTRLNAAHAPSYWEAGLARASRRAASEDLKDDGDKQLAMWQYVQCFAPAYRQMCQGRGQRHEGRHRLRFIEAFPESYFMPQGAASWSVSRVTSTSDRPRRPLATL